jgi:hypothetical protein
MDALSCAAYGICATDGTDFRLFADLQKAAGLIEKTGMNDALPR